MCWDAQINNLQFAAGLFHPSPAFGSRGFSLVGGNRLYSEGELAYVLPKKGKEDCREPPTCTCGQPERELLSWPVTQATRTWGVPLFPSQNGWGLGVPSTGDSTSGENQTRLWCGHRKWVTLPWKGALGQTSSAFQLWKGKKQGDKFSLKRKQEKRRKRKRKMHRLQ